MWILEKAFEVDCTEVAGHLVLYIHRTFAWTGIRWRGAKEKRGESSPRLKMPPFSTDIDPRRCSSRDYTSRPWFPSIVSSNRRKKSILFLFWPSYRADRINARREIAARYRGIMFDSPRYERDTEDASRLWSFIHQAISFVALSAGIMGKTALYDKQWYS